MINEKMNDEHDTGNVVTDLILTSRSITYNGRMYKKNFGNLSFF